MSEQLEDAWKEYERTGEICNSAEGLLTHFAALAKYNRLLDLENKQLENDKKELVKALSYIAERFESHLTDKYYITKYSLYVDGFACQSLLEANELLDKHKCD